MPSARNNLLVMGLAGVVITIVAVGMMSQSGPGNGEAPDQLPADQDQPRPEGAMPGPLETAGNARGAGFAQADDQGGAEPDDPDQAAGTKPAGNSALPEPEPVPEPEPGPIGVFAGRVIARGEPVAGAKLKLYFDSRATGSNLEKGKLGYHRGATSPYGEFRFENVPSGTWSLHVDAAGHTPLRKTGIRLTDDAGIEGYIVVLRAEGDRSVGGLEGRVTGLGDAPVVGARIVADNTETGAQTVAVTDEDGRFRISPLAPGSYSVRMSKPNEEGKTDRMRGATRFVTVTEGQLVSLDFAGGGQLTGLILDAGGAPLVEVIVRIRPVVLKGRYRSMQATTGKDGRFTIENAELTEYKVSVQSVKKGDSFVTEVGTVDLTGGFQDVTFRLSTSGIAGQVILADTGKPPQRPGQQASLSLYRLVPLKDRDGETISGSVGMAFPDKEGRYVFKSVAPGRYRIYVHSRGYRKTKLDFELRAGENKTGVDFELPLLRPGTLIITVTDEEGNPVEGVTFSWNSEGNIWSSLHTEMTRPGVYTIKSLEAGTWRVSAYRSDKGSGRVTVKMTAGATTEVSTVLIPYKPR